MKHNSYSHRMMTSIISLDMDRIKIKLNEENDENMAYQTVLYKCSVLMAQQTELIFLSSVGEC